jgi:uncharacterized protein YueI
VSEEEGKNRAAELHFRAAKETEKLSRYAEVAAKLLKDAHILTMSEDYHAALELVIAAQHTAERVAGRAKSVFEWLLQAATLKNELGVAETRPQTKRPPTGVEL